MKPSVYLAGPITGLTYNGAVDWRESVKQELEPDITAYSPLRGKQYLKTEKTIGDSYEKTLMSSQQSITTRDRFDVQRADLVIFNFLGADRVSIGTCIEIGWADAFRTPGILVIEPAYNFHDHAMVRAICGWRVDNLEDAVYITQATLLP